MQWHRDNNVESTAAEPFVIQSRIEPACHEMTQVNLTPVLKARTVLADDPRPPVGGNRRVEMDCAMGAIGARKRACDCALKWLGTLLAERRDNAGSFCFALMAKIFTGSDICAADGANRRLEKRYDRTHSIKLWGRDHISTKLGLLPTSSPSLQAAQGPPADFRPTMGGEQCLDWPPPVTGGM